MTTGVVTAIKPANPLAYSAPCTSPPALPRRSRRPGRCTLVGAGPGDPELLTLKAVRALRSATVLLVDDLVGDAVLAYAQKVGRKGLRTVHVGKRGGCASTPQAFIERLMAAEALAGEQVVRLKGGDPTVFGRGGEEVAHLQALGVHCEVVNGITAGLAADTAVGVPLTHRDHAHGVLFLTGHPRAASDTPLDWSAVGATAALGVTLVIYMGVATLGVIEHGLLQRLPATTPVAVVQHATLPNQRVLRCVLGGLADAVAAAGMGSPAIVLIGDVVHAATALHLPVAAFQAA